MTYCAALNLKEGMVFASDTRTNAGVDHISTFKKMYTFGVDGERSIIMLTAGNLATSQAVANLLRSGIAQGSAQNLLNLPSLFECAMLVGEQASSVAKTSQHRAHMQEGFGSNFLLGGQIKGQPQELYQIYQEGNCISATEDTPFFQIGESKYGKPIIDRVLKRSSSISHAVKCALISMDSTLRSNLSVGLPLDLATIRSDGLRIDSHQTIDNNDTYFQMIHTRWGESLLQAFEALPDPETLLSGGGSD